MSPCYLMLLYDRDALKTHRRLAEDSSYCGVLVFNSGKDFCDSEDALKYYATDLCPAKDCESETWIQSSTTPIKWHSVTSWVNVTQIIRENHVVSLPICTVALGGTEPWPSDPYALLGGIVIMRLPPECIPIIPSSQPWSWLLSLSLSSEGQRKDLTSNVISWANMQHRLLECEHHYVGMMRF